MDNREAVNWLINISADIGKAEHSDLWHYEQALTEIKDMLESAQLSLEGTTKGTTSDTISRQAAVELAMEYCPDDDGTVQCDGDIRELLDELENLPPAQPERKKGEWIQNNNGTYSCSLCHSWIPEEQHYYAQFCLYCGADMRGEQHETN